MSANIKVGDRIPDYVYFGTMKKGDELPSKITAGEVFRGKKVVLFGIPGAFTSVCSSKHLPQFVNKSKELKDKGVDIIACTAVNDPFVLREWAAVHDPKGEILMLGDAELNFHKPLGLTQQLSLVGERGLRFSMFVNNGIIEVLNIEEGGPGSYKISGPEHMLKDLENLKK